MVYKEHKKMYKIGKRWAVATLVSASVLMGGALTAHADQVEANNSGDVQVAGTAQTTTSQAAVTSSASSSAATTQDDKATAAQASDATDTSSVANNDNEQTQLKQATPDEGSVAAQSNLGKLNSAAANAVKNAKIDAGSLTADQINELNKIDFSASAEKGAKLTYKDLEGIGNAIISQDPKYAIPYFNAKKIQNMPAAYAVDAQTGQMAHLDVWDSWPVQDAVTGYVSNYKGYQLVIAMMGIPKAKYGDNHIYLLYNKYGDNDFSHWRNAGSIFGNNENNVFQEWSGSAIVNNDGSIQLFYTSNDTSDFKLNDQKLATATLHLNVDENGVSIAGVDNNHVLFEGDGYHYQNYQQFANGANRQNDDYCLRDPHVVQLENGDRYLVFEANTGTEDYQGDQQIYKWVNYGGDDAFNINSFFKLLNNKQDRVLAGEANGALGILKLDNNQTNPKVEAVYSPLVSTLMASDEVERPDIVKLGDKYYLFSVTRVSRGTDTELTAKDNTLVGDNVVMIGYVADSLTGTYKPLNQSGVVLTASVPANWRTATYSYYAVPVQGHPDQVLVTSYMSNKDFASGEGNYATWAPSFLVQVNPDDTTTVLARATNQGDWIWDDSSRNDSMLGVLDEHAANSAALPGEWGKPVDWTNINRSSGLDLKPHQPADQQDNKPTDNPGNKPGNNPTDNPGNNPTDNPGNKPGNNPTDNPGNKLGNNPTDNPGNKPGNNPTDNPGNKPGNNSTDNPGNKPGNNPTDNPGSKPGNNPTDNPDHHATNNNTRLPQTGNSRATAGLYAGSLLMMFGLAALDKRYNK